MMFCSVIIVAAGRGVRAGGIVPKQFMPLGGRPVLMHTISAFEGLCDEIIVVVPRGNSDYWHSLCAEYKFITPHKVVEGDDERFLSVQCALSEVNPKADSILVHDGVRPFVSAAVIERVKKYSVEYGAVVPVIPISDSLRKVGGGIVSRSEIVAVQTPQGFSAGVLISAYKQHYRTEFTDDASVVESNGDTIDMVEGDASNFKITTPHDVALAEMILNNTNL